MFCSEKGLFKCRLLLVMLSFYFSRFVSSTVECYVFIFQRF
jgi:hypothetical protein